MTISESLSRALGQFFEETGCRVAAIQVGDEIWGAMRREVETVEQTEGPLLRVHMQGAIITRKVG